MRRASIVVLVLPLLLSAGPATTSRLTPSTNRADPRVRVEAAKAMLAAVEERVRREAVGSAWEIEEISRWSKRLLLAELDAASSQTERERAAEDYLVRIRGVGQRLHAAARVDVNRLDAAAVNYHFVEASEILACIRTGKRLPSTCD